MKKVFEKHGMLKSIGVVLDIIGIILIICSIPVSNEVAITTLRLTGILSVILGTYGILFKNLKEK